MKKLIATRKHIGLTQTDLAQELGITQPDISKIEGLERKIDALELLEWFQVFSQNKQINIDELWNEIYEDYCKH